MSSMKSSANGVTDQPHPNQSQPNAQNSELDPQVHPSGARIEQMIKNTRDSKGEKLQNSRVENPDQVTKTDKGFYGETLRPSEREDEILKTDR